MNYNNNPESYRRDPKPNYGSSKNERESVDSFISKLNFDSKWITIGADENMVKFAEEAGKYMAPTDNRDKDALSKSQIRNVFGEIKRIQGKIQPMKEFDAECKSAFMLLKPKVAYSEGRNKTKGMSLFKKIFDIGWEQVCKNINDKVSFLNFCNLLEAILAYHRANGGKD